MKFLIDKELINEFGGFTLKSGSENGRGGFSVDPFITPEGGSCGGSCSSCG